MVYPLPDTNEPKMEVAQAENVFDHLFRHLLQRFEFLRVGKDFVSKVNQVTFENLGAKPKVLLFNAFMQFNSKLFCVVVLLLISFWAI